MTEYISKNKACMALTKARLINDNRSMVDIFNEIPTEDVAPVKHGKWLNTNQTKHLRCSECDVIHFIGQYPNGNINYCPNCGAKMDLEGLNNESNNM